MDRFETIRDTTLSKYRMMARPQARSAPTTAAAAAVHECMPVKGGGEHSTVADASAAYHSACHMTLQGKLSDAVDLAVDAVSILCLGA